MLVLLEQMFVSHAACVHMPSVSYIAMVSEAQLKEAFASACSQNSYRVHCWGLVLWRGRAKQTLIAGLISDSENNASYSWPPLFQHHGMNGYLMNILFLQVFFLSSACPIFHIERCPDQCRIHVEALTFPAKHSNYFLQLTFPLMRLQMTFALCCKRIMVMNPTPFVVHYNPSF